MRKVGGVYWTYAKLKVSVDGIDMPLIERGKSVRAILSGSDQIRFFARI